MKQCVFFRNKKGSSSIMVMLIMIVLVVFGVLALMSSYSDFKLAKKSATWHAKYYELDAKGEEFVSKVNSKLKEAASQTEKISPAIGLVDSYYYRLVKAKLSKLVKEYKIKTIDTKEGLIVNATIQDADKNKLGISLVVGMLSKRDSNNTNSANPDTVVSVSDVSNSNSNNGVVKYSSSSNLASDRFKYYKVSEWKQLPKEFKYEGQNDLWNGEVTNP